MRYYFHLLDVFNRNFRAPLRQAEYFSFFHGVDTKKPLISHNPITEIIQFEPTLVISATIKDNIGLESVILRYRLNEDPFYEVGMHLVNNDTYAYQLNLTSMGLQPGDKIEYQIIATDSSSQNNMAVFPESGWIKVDVKKFEVRQTYSNNFDNLTNDFYGDFTITAPTGFVNRAIHSPHPYSNDTSGTGLNLVYFLLYPIKVQEENATLQFDEVVLVEPGMDTDYNSPLFGDYVIVEASNDMQNWFPLTPGYDSRKHIEWLNYYNSNIQNGDSKAVGTLNYFKRNTIDMLQTLEPGDTVYIRFRLYSNNEKTGWGWAIDNLRIQDQITQVNRAENSLSAGACPDPFISFLHIFNPEPDATPFKIYNFLGQSIFFGILQDKLSIIDLGFLAPGPYLLEIQGRSGSSQRLIIKR